MLAAFRARILVYLSGVIELRDYASKSFPLDLVFTVRGAYKESLKLFSKRGVIKAVRKVYSIPASPYR